MKTFVLRLLGFIPVAIMLLIPCIILYGKYLFNFCKYGGEFITYTKDTNKETILEVFKKLKDGGQDNT